TSFKVSKETNHCNSYCVHEALVRAEDALIHITSAGKQSSSPAFDLRIGGDPRFSLVYTYRPFD
ncbi:unnamed protein product, partial [marine sediment metagenome]